MGKGTQDLSSSDSSAISHVVSDKIREMRKAAGLSHSQLANRVGYSRQYISRAEQPSQGLPSGELVAAIDGALDARGVLIRLRSDAHQERLQQRGVDSLTVWNDPTKSELATLGSNVQSSSVADASALGVRTGMRTEHVGPLGSEADSQKEVAISESLALLSSLAATHVDALVLDDIEERVDALASGYYRISPAEFRTEVTHVRRRAFDILRATGKLSQQRRLYGALAGLTAMLAESAFALGENVDSHREAALELSKEAEHPALTGWIRGTQAQIALHTGNPSAAIRYARSGEGAPDGSAAAVRSATYLARASARLGDRAGAYEAWRSAEQAWSRFGGSASSSVFSLSPEYLECCQLTMLAWLGESVRGTRYVDQMAAPTSPTVGRAIREIDIALIRVSSGELDEAVASARRAIDIGAKRWTTPLQDRYAGLVEAILPYGTSVVNELQRGAQWTSG